MHGSSGEVSAPSSSQRLPSAAAAPSIAIDAASRRVASANGSPGVSFETTIDSSAISERKLLWTSSMISVSAGTSLTDSLRTSCQSAGRSRRNSKNAWKPFHSACSGVEPGSKRRADMLHQIGTRTLRGRPGRGLPSNRSMSRSSASKCRPAPPLDPLKCCGIRIVRIPGSPLRAFGVRAPGVADVPVRMIHSLVSLSR